MQIRLDLDQSSEGRLTGTLGLVGDEHSVAFSGNLELLARLEELCRSNDEQRTSRD